jgi:hypothetical protein
MNAYAKKVGICTQCFSAYADKSRVQCQRCIDRAKNKRKRDEERYHGYCNNNYHKKQERDKQREKVREYKAKKLTKKIRKLSLIQREIEGGKNGI